MNGMAGSATAPATVAEYAARVREHLAGMPADQVDDLTDGLEADLADALADEAAPDGSRGDLVAVFGPPEVYARELRVAAGLPEPERAPARVGVRGRLRGMRDDARHAVLRATAGMRAQPWWPGVRDFGVAVRPLWWFLRGWVGYQVVLQVIGGRYANGGGRGGWVPSDLFTWLVLAALVVLSVQWGRGLWLPRSTRWLPAAATAVGVVLLLPAAAWASNGAVRWETEYVYDENGAVVEYPHEDGVWVDGMQVSNLFVYDADGEPLSDVQVYDDRGRAVRTTTDDGWSSWSLPGVNEDWTFVPAEDEDGRTRWNVYPLLGAPYDEFDWEEFTGDRPPAEVLTTEPRVPPRPFAKAPALVERAAGEEPADGADQGQDPAQEPSVDPSPDPSADQDGGPGDTASEVPGAAATAGP